MSISPSGTSLSLDFLITSHSRLARKRPRVRMPINPSESNDLFCRRMARAMRSRFVLMSKALRIRTPLGRFIGYPNHGIQQQLRAQADVLWLRPLERTMTDAAPAGNEQHPGGCNLGHLHGIMTGPRGHNFIGDIFHLTALF